MLKKIEKYKFQSHDLMRYTYYIKSYRYDFYVYGRDTEARV